MTPSDLPDPTWFGLHERLRTPSLERALAGAGLVEGTHFRWEKAPPREELAPLVAAHLARAFHQVTASLRDTPEGMRAWEAALGELARGLAGGQAGGSAGGTGGRDGGRQERGGGRGGGWTGRRTGSER
jgi:hypothetical protein